jgi:UbiA prenyltransferase family
MTVAAANPVSLGTLLRLGRVSNLPTVWSNVVAATVLAGAELATATTATVMLAMTAFYLGGMYLNDAFDRDVDARERPGRPIPAGEIAPLTVFWIGLGLLVVGIALMSISGTSAGLAGLVLAAAIVGYNLHHKGVGWSPLLMGACRTLVYVGAGIAASGTVAPALVLGALALCAHVVGLSFAAKQESLNRIDHLWPLGVLAIPFAVGLWLLPSGALGLLAAAALLAADGFAISMLKTPTATRGVPHAVSLMIAAIALVDALVASTTRSGIAVLLCFGAFALTCALQRYVPGT